MLTNDTTRGPAVTLDASFVQDTYRLRAEAKRLRDFFLAEAARVSALPLRRAVTLTFDYENLSSIASLLHQLSSIGSDTAAKD